MKRDTHPQRSLQAAVLLPLQENQNMEINAPDNLFSALQYLSIAFLLAAFLVKLKSSLPADDNFVIYQLCLQFLQGQGKGWPEG